MTPEARMYYKTKDLLAGRENHQKRIALKLKGLLFPSAMTAKKKGD